MLYLLKVKPLVHSIGGAHMSKYGKGEKAMEKFALQLQEVEASGNFNEALELCKELYAALVAATFPPEDSDFVGDEGIK